jgi:hypothetical protein
MTRELFDALQRIKAAARNISSEDWQLLEKQLEVKKPCEHEFVDRFFGEMVIGRECIHCGWKTQLPVHGQLAHKIGKAWRDCGALSASPPDWALQFAQNLISELKSN